ncbi:LysR substrate-binding domain-containing protein, partial [Paraburkholderia madseniana]
ELYGEPGEPADLLRHECLRLKPAEVAGWTLHREKETVEIAVGGRFLLNSVGMIRRLATLDLGIAVLPEEIAADDVAAGLLRRVMQEWQAPSVPVYAITETRLLPAKTQRFIEFLREHLGA